ncbi:MAG: HAMP domain-containing histidine kinase [Saprospiraceae bacterium]|nr:HAMP domain-containing histidine kinase [Saprospiraceae bacterium]
MDIYEKKSRWKVYLALAGIAIIAISMVYTIYISRQLAEGEKSKVELYKKVLESLNDPENLNKDISFETELINSNILKNIPVIFVDESGVIYGGANWGSARDTNMVFLQKKLEDIKSSGRQPIQGEGYARYIYYEHTRLLKLLTIFPIIQVFLILVFVFIGYLAFSSAKKSEQNQVWIGMAKETAHQLGTPISAILAWIEHLDQLTSEKSESAEIIGELKNDVNRLELIADRFSKIGSTPTLKKINLIEELEKNRTYMQKRAPRKVLFDFPEINQTPVYAEINPHLFDWVIENLIRNALDAMDGSGKIQCSISQNENSVNIDLTDSGKGIPSSKWKTVFQPGYTTKKRGWGLGLSLAKRIIESYHHGKIFVKHSAPDQGTTFSIQLPYLKN